MAQIYLHPSVSDPTRFYAAKAARRADARCEREAKWPLALTALFALTVSCALWALLIATAWKTFA